MIFRKKINFGTFKMNHHHCYLPYRKSKMNETVYPQAGRLKKCDNQPQEMRATRMWSEGITALMLAQHPHYFEKI